MKTLRIIMGILCVSALIIFLLEIFGLLADNQFFDKLANGFLVLSLTFSMIEHFKKPDTKE